MAGEVADHKLGEVAGHNAEGALMGAVHGKAVAGVRVDGEVQVLEVVDTGQDMTVEEGEAEVAHLVGVGLPEGRHIAE